VSIAATRFRSIDVSSMTDNARRLEPLVEYSVRQSSVYAGR
jgi:oligoribonuclease (3'-5' exoribonuclease)